MKPLLFGGLLAALLAPAWPQQLQSPPVISVKTDLVTLAVTVVDARGRFVGGLQQQDFSVFDEREQRPIEFFSSEDIPATIGLVVDSSSSMRERRDDVTVAATAFAAISHPGDEFFTVNFNEAVWPGLPPGVPFTQDVAQLRAALTAAPARGMTAVYDAVDRALDYLAFGSRDRKALIVVSDGGDNASSRTLDGVLDHARRSGAAVYTVIIVNPNDHGARPGTLKRLAADTGGRAFAPDSSAEVVGAFQQIARDIRSGYTIGFVPPESATGFRSIQVIAKTADNARLVARTRAGYYADGSRQGDR